MERKFLPPCPDGRRARHQLSLTPMTSPKPSTSSDQLTPDPTAGLPEDLFLFISRITPLVNVDLLIQDDAHRTSPHLAQRRPLSRRLAYSRRHHPLQGVRSPAHSPGRPPRVGRFRRVRPRAHRRHREHRPGTQPRPLHFPPLPLPAEFPTRSAASGAHRSPCTRRLALACRSAPRPPAGPRPI